MKKLITLCTVLFFYGCASSYEGNPAIYEQENIAKIIVGKSTKQDMLGLFGEPQGISTEGKEILFNYAFVWARANGITMTSDSGGFGLGIFFENGVVTKYVTNTFGNYLDDRK